MSALHIVQGGIDNGDTKALQRAARLGLNLRSWVAPKAAAVGDSVVIYVASHGFFATALVNSPSRSRPDWPNRYGSGLTSIKLIEPAISLAAIRRRIPDLTWANYPRSITTPPAPIANQIRKLISRRRMTGVSDLVIEDLDTANIAELRRAALLKALPSATKKKRVTIQRVRARAISLFVLHRANGRCEACNAPAPFRKPDGSAYLEPHHTDQLSEEGADHPAKVLALCPNCHRRAHHSVDSKSFNRMLVRKSRALWIQCK